MDLPVPVKYSLDEILSQLTLASPPVLPKKVLFGGEGAGEISSYVVGWMAGQGLDAVVLDGANRFDPYMVSSFAKRVFVSPENLLKRIRIARAFTCFQMATLIEGKLVSLVREEGSTTVQHKPWVILLGPITTFLDEDVPEREIRPLFERSLRKIEEMAMEGVPFFLFQSSRGSKNNLPFSPFTPCRKSLNRAGPAQGGAKEWLRGVTGSRETYLMKRLFQISNLICRIDLEEEGLKLILEKGFDSVIPVLARRSASVRRANGNPGKKAGFPASSAGQPLLPQE